MRNVRPEDQMLSITTTTNARVWGPNATTAFLRVSKAHRSDSAPGSLARQGSKSYGSVPEFSPKTKPQNHKTTKPQNHKPQNTPNTRKNSPSFSVCSVYSVVAPFFFRVFRVFRGGPLLFPCVPCVPWWPLRRSYPATFHCHPEACRGQQDRKTNSS